MQVVRAQEAFPAYVTKTIFLAGPSPRDNTTPSWRPEAVRILQSLGFDGHVFNPEPTEAQPNYDNQIEWEEEAMRRADVIVFWVPRSDALPGFTTNTEFGAWRKSGKLVWGCPPDAPKVRYQQHHCSRECIPQFDNLTDTLKAAIAFVGTGYERFGALLQLPSFVLKRQDFQAWHNSLLLNGNTLERVNLEWSLWSGPGKKRSFIHILSASVYLTKEERTKSNEVLVLRPDISSVVLYCAFTSEVVLVSEYRLPVLNGAGLVYELPGGSSWTPESALQTAQSEVSEEVGLDLLESRFEYLGTRQIAATLSVHRCHLYAVALTIDEMEAIKAQEGPNGNLEDSERTLAVVMSFNEALTHPHIDWSTKGAIAEMITKG